MKPSKPTRKVRGGHQALVSHDGDRVYLGTYDTEPEALFAHHAARAILGIAQQGGVPHPDPETAATIREKVRARLQAHAGRPGKHHRSDALVRRDSTTGYKGVTMFPKPWRAHISRGNRRYSLGTYRTAVEAAFASNLAASILHGPNALLNPIPTEESPVSCRVEGIRQQVANHLGSMAAENQSLRPPT